MAPRAGLEPATIRLTVEASTIEVPGYIGGQSWDWTSHTKIFSLVLYQLSYLPMVVRLGNDPSQPEAPDLQSGPRP